MFIVLLSASVMCVIHKLVLFVSTGTDSVRKAKSTSSPVLETEGVPYSSYTVL